MKRMQIRLTEEQSRRLEQLAATTHTSKAALVRRAVDVLLTRRALEPSMEERRRRALSVIGRFRSGHRDTAEEHDAVHAEAYHDR
jgi:hypothetical protein